MRFPIQLVFFYQIKIRRLPRAMYPSRQLNRPPDHPRDCETYQHRPPCHGGHDYVVKCQRGGRRCGATLRFRPISAEIGCRRADLGRNRSKAPPPPPRRRQRDHPPNANTLSDANALRDWPGGAAAARNGFVKVDVLMYTYVYLFLLDKEISRTHNHAKPEYGSKKITDSNLVLLHIHRGRYKVTFLYLIPPHVSHTIFFKMSPRIILKLGNTLWLLNRIACRTDRFTLKSYSRIFAIKKQCGKMAWKHDEIRSTVLIRSHFCTKQ